MLITILLYVVCAGALLTITIPFHRTIRGKTFYPVFHLCNHIQHRCYPRHSRGLLPMLSWRRWCPNHICPAPLPGESGTWLGASVLGHASAGFLIAYAGYTRTFSLIIIFILISAVAAFLISPKPPQHNKKEQKTWDSVKEGLKYVMGTKELLGAMALDLFAVLFGGTVAMIPFFAGDILKVELSGLDG